MASTDLKINNSSQDVIAILNGADFTQLFPLASPMAVRVREGAKISKYEVEDGSERSDNIIYTMIEIEIPFLLVESTRNVFANMRQAFRSQQDFIIQTRVHTYKNMCISDLPHDEPPELGTGVTVNVKFTEVRPVNVEFGTLPASKVANKSQASTRKRGNQQTTESDGATRRKASVLSEIFN